MGKIKVLDKLIANMIAAGEVVERPASVVKELFENSVDASSNRITVEIKDGGKELIKITDDGSGMDKQDAALSVVRYATSKIKDQNDLFSIKTMGFRGEAMASISSVSKMTISTRKFDTNVGTTIEVNGGDIKEISETGCPIGTTVLVKDLFFNTPARLSFMKKSSTESAFIEELVGKLILSNPYISVKFIRDNKEVFYSKGDNNLKNAIYCVYGKDITDNLIYVEGEKDGITIKGYVGNPNIAKPTIKYETFCVNNRICRTKTMTNALEFAYFQKISQGKHPFCVLNIEIDYKMCDVNIHPQKAEVKFVDEKLVYNAILSIVKDALDSELFVKSAVEIKPQHQPYPEYEEKITPQNTFLQDKKTPTDTINKFENATFSPFKKATDFTFLKEDSEIKTNIIPNEKIIPKEEKKDISEEMIDFKIIGQLFETYVVLQKGDELILMDQHAAHERINYEKLRENYKNKTNSSQMMMAPKMIKLSATDYSIVCDNKDVFLNLGIEIDDFSNNTVVVRCIPLDVKEKNIEKLIYEITDAISKSGNMKKEDFNQRLLYLVACKMSIKANMALDNTQMNTLVQKAFLLNGKTTCPHGRPLFVSFSKSYIETKFQR